MNKRVNFVFQRVRPIEVYFGPPRVSFQKFYFGSTFSWLVCFVISISFSWVYFWFRFRSSFQFRFWNLKQRMKININSARHFLFSFLFSICSRYLFYYSCQPNFYSKLTPKIQIYPIVASSAWTLEVKTYIKLSNFENWFADGNKMMNWIIRRLSWIPIAGKNSMIEKNHSRLIDLERFSVPVFILVSVELFNNKLYFNFSLALIFVLVFIQVLGQLFKTKFHFRFCISCFKHFKIRFSVLIFLKNFKNHTLHRNFSFSENSCRSLGTYLHGSVNVK